MDEEIYCLLKMGDWAPVDQHKAVEALAANQRRDAGKLVRRQLIRSGLVLLLVRRLSTVNGLLSGDFFVRADCPSLGNRFAHSQLHGPCLIFSQKWQGNSQNLVDHDLWYSGYAQPTSGEENVHQERILGRARQGWQQHCVDGVMEQ